MFQILWMLILFMLVRVAGLVVCIFSVRDIKQGTSKDGETVVTHRQKYIDQGSSGEWRFMNPTNKLFWFWGNDEDGYWGEPTGKWSASVKGKESSLWNMYIWAAIRNPANNFSRFWGPFSCPASECSFTYKGDYDLNDNAPISEGWNQVTAIHKKTGKKYHAFRLVKKWPGINKCLHIRLGFKLRPSYITNTPDEPKGWTFRITPFASIN